MIKIGCHVITHSPALSPVQSPPKGVTIPYRPKPSGSPVIFAGGQVHITLQRGHGKLLTCFDRVAYLCRILCLEEYLHGSLDVCRKALILLESTQETSQITFQVF